MNMYTKFQLHPSNGFWEEDFLIFFFENVPLKVPWKPIKFSDLDKTHMVLRGLLKEQFYKKKKKKVKISAVRQQ